MGGEKRKGKRGNYEKMVRNYNRKWRRYRYYNEVGEGKKDWGRKRRGYLWGIINWVVRGRRKECIWRKDKWKEERKENESNKKECRCKGGD